MPLIRRGPDEPMDLPGDDPFERWNPHDDLEPRPPVDKSLIFNRVTVVAMVATAVAESMKRERGDMRLPGVVIVLLFVSIILYLVRYRIISKRLLFWLCILCGPILALILLPLVFDLAVHGF
ncbi:hypothetical protein EP7_004742 [Isosphaeraceae bacterium EP7]